MRPRSAHRAGFATMAAIMMIPVVAAAILALTYQFQSQARQTQSARTDAQLHQLLHAGAAEATRLLRGSGVDAELPLAAAIELPLPQTLADSAVRITARKSGQSLLVEILATVPQGRRRQQLRFESVNGSYRLVEAVILPAS